jgi:Tfp pilus assembly protein PilX
MNVLMVILIVSTLIAMVLWAIHIDRRRSGRAAREEERSINAACKKWLSCCRRPSV